MGFKKEIYDVEEKGLDPTKPHNSLGVDGKLFIDNNNNSKIGVIDKQQEIEIKEEVKNITIDDNVVTDTALSSTITQKKDKKEAANALKELPTNNQKENKIIRKKASGRGRPKG